MVPLHEIVIDINGPIPYQRIYDAMRFGSAGDNKAIWYLERTGNYAFPYYILAGKFRVNAFDFGAA